MDSSLITWGKSSVGTFSFLAFVSNIKNKYRARAKRSCAGIPTIDRLLFPRSHKHISDNYFGRRCSLSSRSSSSRSRSFSCFFVTCAGKCDMFIVVRLKEGAGVPQFVTAGSIVFTIQCNGNAKGTGRMSNDTWPAYFDATFTTAGLEAAVAILVLSQIATLWAIAPFLLPGGAPRGIVLL